MKPTTTINIRQLHDKTGEHVRAAAQSRAPIEVTDRGKVVALLVSPQSVPKRVRRRRLLAEYADLLAAPSGSDTVLEDLRAIRGER